MCTSADGRGCLQVMVLVFSAIFIVIVTMLHVMGKVRLSILPAAQLVDACFSQAKQALLLLILLNPVVAHRFGQCRVDTIAM